MNTFAGKIPSVANEAAVGGQLLLPFAHTEHSLRGFLEHHLKMRIELVITDNAITMLSVRARNGRVAVRLHRMFLDADSLVLTEIAAYLKDRRVAMPHFRAYLRDNRGRLARRPPRSVSIQSTGRHHELTSIFDELNREYFDGRISTAITWGNASPRSRVRTRTLGSYSERSNIIRINPVLDRKGVPRYYVALIVYHEMLHADLGTPLRGKRRQIHTAEFKRRERLFKDYERAMAWE